MYEKGAYYCKRIGTWPPQISVILVNLWQSLHIPPLYLRLRVVKRVIDGQERTP